MPRAITAFHPSPTSYSYYNSYTVPSSSSEGKKLIIVSVLIIVAVVLFICFYIYCCSAKSRPSHVVPGTTTTVVTFTVTSTSSACGTAAAVGLDSEQLARLPIFIYASSVKKESDDKLECVVCLMEFKQGEKGRLIPICGHKFHTECVEMWLSCHKTCPLCRSSLDSEQPETK